MDESGDLGFSARSSRYLVVVALATEEPHRLSRIVRRAHRRFSIADKAGSEFKFNRSGERLRRFFLEGISDTDSWIVWNAASKSGAIRRSMADPDAFWQYVTVRTVSELARGVHARSMVLTIDRLSPRPNVNRALAGRLADELRGHHAGCFPPLIEVRLVNSGNSEGLQVADYVAGAVFRSVERNDPFYLGLLKKNIVRGNICW